MSNVARVGSVALTTSAGQILPANNNRLHLIVTKDSTQDIFLGCNSTVSTTSSFQFSGGCGTQLTLPNFHGALWGVLGAGGTTVTYLEVTG